jgi:hypothetical protein
MMIFSFYWLTFATCMAAVAPNSVIGERLGLNRRGTVFNAPHR